MDYVAPLVSFAVTFLVTAWIIKVSKARGFVGKDVNKPNKPEVPVLGGVGIVAGFVGGSFALLVDDQSEVSETIILASLISSLIVAFLGLLDDVLNIRQSVRALTPTFASVPLAIFSVGHSVISIPFLGFVNLGLLYYVVVIPAALTISANAFNMLEGLNGLGTGMGIIMAATLAFIGLRGSGQTYIAGELALVLAASLVAFLFYNKYPAKVFLGNIGTYFIGSAIGAIGISGFMLTALAVLYLPYVAEFVLKARTKFKGISFGKVTPEGYLYWDGKPNSLTHVVMKMGHFKEYQVVLILWGLEIAFAVLAVYLQTTVIKL
ncbi:MAG: glycosyl transferase family protein [Candidatus Aramenus sulfurataquae]|uniref:Glycosyl transferase family protein n=2 Tax=Candidatus Aramenus sulfurataquae TaxID=1326980 RepID=W7KPX5_9CREN|nr:MAG: glycosyl transferase family protein [Candidatus Aramenus sulfurataquae]MCL7343029.1 UDP-N-acetylglucosamine--dolichyl-phosphate N-acetylglucosaminephosphotransferase [Candidatus Aramenus sulfurataquae]